MKAFQQIGFSNPILQLAQLQSRVMKISQIFSVGNWIMLFNRSDLYKSCQKEESDNRPGVE